MWENSVPAPKHASAPAASKIDFTGERFAAPLGRGTRGVSRVNRCCAVRLFRHFRCVPMARQKQHHDVSDRAVPTDW